ncbi:MAG: hypothetical protein ABI904_22835 [Chloroflexota bacterium]
MKTISIFLALINSLFAGFLIALDLSYNTIHINILWWSLLKLSTASLIIVIGITVWLEVMGMVRTGPVLLGSLFLIALGPATIVWAIHLALTTGNLEFQMVVFSVSLMVQGMASLLGTAGESRNATAS